MTDSRRAPLLVLSTCAFFAICTEMLPVGLLPEIGRGLGVSESAAGVLVSVYALLVVVASVPLAAVAERWPRRAVLSVLLGTYALSNVIFAAAPGYGVALVARVVGGVAHGGFFAVAVAAAVALVAPERSGRAIAVVMAGNGVALVLGVPLGTSLGTLFGWRWSFVVVAVALLALAVAVRRALPDDRSVVGGTVDLGPDAPPPRTSVLDGVRRPLVLVMAVVISLLALGHFTLYTYVSPLLLHDGVPRTQVGTLLFVYGCGGIVGLVVAGVVATWRPYVALAADMVLMGLGLVLAASVTSTAGLVVVLVVWGVAFGGFPTLTQTVMLRVARDAADAGTALVNATSNVGIAGGALLGSQLLAMVAVPALGWVGAGLVAASLVVYLAVIGPVRRRARLTV